MPTRRFYAIVLLNAAVLAGTGSAQTPIRLAEDFSPGSTTAVELRVEIAGRLTLPAAKDKPSRELKVVGRSLLKYDEQVLSPDDAGGEKVLRQYAVTEFERSVGDTPQKAEVRAAVRRMVVHRTEKAKSAFSPDGPLTWNDLDAVRTDVFGPALVSGLLGGKDAKPGDSWQASAAAVRELTDLETVEAGGLTIKFEAVVPVKGVDHARLSVSGTIRGVDEYGPARHTLDGTAYFDLTAKRLDYLGLTATRELLDGTGKANGRMDGRFTLTRTKATPVPEADLAKLDLKPSATNTRLLYENPALGAAFLYPRRWRVGAVQGKQITLDGPNGAGLLVTLEPAGKLPTAAAYKEEVVEFLKKQKATVGAVGEVSKLGTADRFGIDAVLAGETVRMEYAVVPGPAGGAVIAARLPRADAAVLVADVDAVVKSLALKAPEAKK